MVVLQEKVVQLITIDGGENWITKQSGVEDVFFSSSFLNADTGFVVGGGGLLLKTENGGESWSIKETGTFSTLWDISFENSGTGWAVGTGGTIINSSTE